MIVSAFAFGSCLWTLAIGDAPVAMGEDLPELQVDTRPSSTPFSKTGSEENRSTSDAKSHADKNESIEDDYRERIGLVPRLITNFTGGLCGSIAGVGAVVPVAFITYAYMYFLGLGGGNTENEQLPLYLLLGSFPVVYFVVLSGTTTGFSILTMPIGLPSALLRGAVVGLVSTAAATAMVFLSYFAFYYGPDTFGTNWAFNVGSAIGLAVPIVGIAIGATASTLQALILDE